MGEPITVQEEKFFRPKKKREDRGGERIQGILRKAIRVAFRLLFISFFLFVGHHLYVFLLTDSSFRVGEVEVEGCQRMTKETLLSLAKMEGMPNLFTIQLNQVAKRLESHPWIEQVRVRKIFPNKILIQVEEKKPIAIIQLEEFYYIDRQGVIFAPVGDQDRYNFPFLTGLSRQVLEKDPVHANRLITKALELLRITDKAKVSPLEEISEIHMEKAFGIRCITKAEGIEVRMGWEHFEEKLNRLAMIWTDLQKRGFSAVSIDCSDLKRVIVKKIPGRGI